MDANLLHISYEGGVLEDPWNEPDETMWRWSVSPEQAPDQPRHIELDYRNGDIVAIDGEALTPAAVLTELNQLGGTASVGWIWSKPLCRHEIARLLRNPGGTIMLKAHQAIGIADLGSGSRAYQDELMPRYASLVYNGYWWSPERKLLQTMIDESQVHVNGTVRVKLYKGQRDRGRSQVG